MKKVIKAVRIIYAIFLWLFLFSSLASWIVGTYGSMPETDRLWRALVALACLIGLCQMKPNK